MLDLNITATSVAKTLKKTYQAVHKFCGEHKIDFIKTKHRCLFSPQSLRGYLEKFDYKYPQDIIAFQACKGGVGKTSLCFNMAIRAAQYGAKVLAIDMDMQSHLTLALVGNNNIHMPVWNDVLKGKSIKEIVQEVHPHLHLIASNLDNSYLDKVISQSNKVVYTSYVHDHLCKIKKDYDLILIDCAPALSHINTAIAIAADKIIIPVNPDLFSFDGLEKTLTELTDIQKSFNKDLDVNIILNRYDNREKNSLDVIVDLKNMYGKLLFSTFVVVSSEIKNAISQRKLIFNMKKKPQAANDIDEIVKDLLEMESLYNA